MFLGVVRLDLGVHQRLDLVRVEVARDHHAQVVGDELDDVVVVADDGVLLEQRGAVRILDVLLDGHQAFLARLLQDVVQQRQQFHVARLAELAALEAGAQALHRALDHLHLVVGQERSARRAEDRDELHRQRVRNDGDVAFFGDVHAEDATQCDDPADDHKHFGYASSSLFMAAPDEWEPCGFIDSSGALLEGASGAK